LEVYNNKIKYMYNTKINQNDKEILKAATEKECKL